MPKTILIIGGGYAGIAAAKGLLKQKIDARITLIDQNSYHALPSDYYELATTHLSEKRPTDWEHVKQSVAVPFVEIFAHQPISIKEDRLMRVDLTRHTALFARNGKQRYDYLLLALGAETNFSTITRLREYSHGFKTIPDVLGARNAIDELFARKAKHEPINIVIGGGGFTGCEVAAELIGFVKKLADQHSHPRSSLSVTIVEAGAALLPGGSSWLQATAKKRLEKLGITIIFQKPITSVAAHEVLFDGLSLPYDMLFWTAGVKANSFFNQWNEATKAKGRCIGVDQTLRLPGYQNVFILGDAASCPNPATGKPEPMTAQVAIRHGRYAAAAIANLLQSRAPKPYLHKNPLLLVPLGGKYAILDLGVIRIRGFTGWLLKRLTLLRYLCSLFPFFKAFPRWLATTYLFTKND